MQKLKYEDQFKVGDKIRAYDFQNVPDHYVEGSVLRTDTHKYAICYVIACVRDTLASSHRVGKEVYVPMETLFESEWKFERVTKILPRKEIKSWAGFRYARRSPLTGNWLVVCKTSDHAMDDENGTAKWMSICEEHNTICTHQTLALAKDHLQHPEWCDGCQLMMELKTS